MEYEVEETKGKGETGIKRKYVEEVNVGGPKVSPQESEISRD